MIQIVTSDCFEFLQKIGDNSIDLIIIDPPYQSVTREDWDKVDVVNYMLSQELFRVAKSTSSLYVWCGIGEKSQSLIRWFPLFTSHWYFKDLITWKKNRGNGNKKGWLYTREECMWFVKDNKQFTWNTENQYSSEKRPWHVYKAGGQMVNKSQYKRHTNVWMDINEVGYGRSPKAYKEIRSKLTYTPKPVEALERIILAHTKPGDLVLDCFLGSGSTALAAKNTGRRFTGCDINKEYCEIALSRLT